MSETLKKMIRVITIDDHNLVRQGIVNFLSLYDDIDVVAQADNIEQGLALIEELQPDVILMDLQFGKKLSGIEATAAIKNNGDSGEVIILTSYHQDETIFPAFAAGALSYLLKDILPQELADAVRKAAQGQAVLSPEVAIRLLKHTRELDKKSPLFELSKRETQVLKLIANGHNNAEIAEQLFISVKTVRSHVSNLLSKLQLRDRTQAAVHAWQHGLMS